MELDQLFAISGGGRAEVSRGFRALMKVGGRARLFVFYATLIMSLFYGLLQAQAQEARVAISLKAAFITKFVEFVEWPGERISEGNSPIIIGVLGEDPMLAELAKALEGAKFKSHPFQLDHYQKAQGIKDCHILFISPSEMPRLQIILTQIENKPFLTVGDAASFCAEGGMINFIEKENKVRFQINLEAVRRAGLKMNSKLLKVSVLVKEEKRQ